MRKITSFCALVVFAFVACGGNGGGGNSNPPPTPQITVAIAPEKPSVAVNGSIQFTDVVQGTTDASVTWSITSGAGTINQQGLYTAPASTGTATVTVTSNADKTKSASATVPIVAAVSVDVTPTGATVEVGKTEQFAATVNGSQDGVNWYVAGELSGNPTVGIITASGLYTAPVAVPNPATVEIKACLRTDNSKCGKATITITAAQPSQLQARFYAPPGGTASGVGIVPSAGLIVVAVNSTPSGQTDPLASFLFYNADLSGEPNVFSNPVASQISAITFDSVSGNVFATGFVGGSANPDAHAAVVVVIVPGNPPVVQLNKSFQLNGRGTEGRAIGVVGNQIYLAAHLKIGITSPPDPLCTLAFNACPEDKVAVLNSQGSPLQDFPVGNTPTNEVGDRTEITGMSVAPDLWAVGNKYMLVGQELELTGHYVEKFSLSGQPQTNPLVVGGVFDTKVVEDGLGNVFVAGTSDLDINKTMFNVERRDPLGNIIRGFVWNGDNPGQVSMNRPKNVFLNKAGGPTVVGSCSKIGGIDPNITDACAISWDSAGNVIWKKRFSDGAISVWNSGVALDQRTFVFAGTGSDGRGCGTPPCAQAVIAKFTP